MSAEKRQYEFIIKENAEKNLVFLGSRGDPAGMNWVQGKRKWGTVICPDTLSVKTERMLTENGRLKESYCFTNITAFPVVPQMTDVGIYTTFHDNYEAAAECMERRCHTHLFCGKEASYIQALRMGGRPPHLGLQLVEGSIVSYSVERDEEKRSDDRGDFILHPEFPLLEPGESMEVAWELFWFEDQKDFENKLLEKSGFPYVTVKNATYFPGEQMRFAIRVYGRPNAVEVFAESDGNSIPCRTWTEKSAVMVEALGNTQREGEYRFRIRINGTETYALLYRCADLDRMAQRRCCFIVKKQQYRMQGSPLDGAYLIYDREEDRLHYSHVDDHNGGRERLGMGALLALYLQRNEDSELYDSLIRYQRYVYRELYDRNSGTVYNDICRNNDWHRLYNYPWMVIFQLECYRLTKECCYLTDAFCTMQKYYESGGSEFYAIGIPMTDLLSELEEADRGRERKLLEEQFLKHADSVLRIGINYPASEVSYEQSIVAPAISILLQAEKITGNGIYMEEAKRQMKVLELFNGMQPDYHLYSNAIRHWDGYWFGKRQMYGDTFPHYWSVLSGVAYAQMYEMTDDSYWRSKASASFRGCLNLFEGDGFASCAMVFPRQVNGKEASYYDPWANDQDWALYYALKYKEITKGEDGYER